MKGATQCAKRLKTLVRKLRSALGKVNPPPAGEPIDQLILGIFSRDTTETKAADVLDRIKANVVDYNELRVIPPIELAELVGNQPRARLKCEDLSRALNSIFAIEHQVTLDHLLKASRKDLAAYLDRLEGLEGYTRARMRLLGFGKLAIPLDEAMWAYARKTEIVDPNCPLEEAQAFLERQIAEKDALEFFALVRKQAWTELGPAVRKQQVTEIASVPPDRTTRNMLQLVSGGDELPSPATPAEPEPEPEAPAPKKRAKATATKPKRKPKATKSAAPKATKKAKKATPAARKTSRKATKKTSSKRARSART